MKICKFAAGMGLLTAAILIAACSPGKPQAPLDDTAWRAIEIKGAQTSPEVVSTLMIVGATGIRGAGGCNNFDGSATIDTNTISFAKIAATRRACDEIANGQELAYFDALAVVAAFERIDQQLLLKNDAGDTVILLKQVLE